MSDLVERARRVRAIAERFDSGEALMRRWLGAWLDFVAAFLCMVVIAGPFSVVLGNSDAGVALIGLIAIAVALLYYIVTEAIWGRTLGKLVTGLVVVNKYGHPPGFGLALVRTLFRMVEVNPFLLGGIPAGICVLATRQRQRLGDLVANTYVLPVKDVKALDATVATVFS